MMACQAAAPTCAQLSSSSRLSVLQRGQYAASAQDSEWNAASGRTQGSSQHSKPPAQCSGLPLHWQHMQNASEHCQAPGILSRVRCSVSCSQRLKSSGDSTRCSNAGLKGAPHCGSGHLRHSNSRGSSELRLDHDSTCVKGSLWKETELQRKHGSPASSATGRAATIIAR